MLFDFCLRPLEDVHSWGSPDNLRLSWFGFTDGFYRLQVDSEYLLNYSDDFINYSAKTSPSASLGSSVDYYVVRLWEDILDILPSVLEPVPAELHSILRMNDLDWSTWLGQAQDWLDHQPESRSEQAWDTFEMATSWRCDRHLSSAYLSHSPRIWLWSTDEEVVISWDNQAATVEGIPVWSASQGNYVIDREKFLEEIHAFHNEFIAQMGQRVESISSGWHRPEIDVDIAHLNREHSDRSTWLSNALQRIPSTNWNQVLFAIQTLSIN